MVSLKYFSLFSRLKFVAKEHINGMNNVEPKEVIIEPDGPSNASKDDEDDEDGSKVN